MEKKRNLPLALMINVFSLKKKLKEIIVLVAPPWTVWVFNASCFAFDFLVGGGVFPFAGPWIVLQALSSDWARLVKWSRNETRSETYAKSDSGAMKFSLDLPLKFEAECDTYLHVMVAIALIVAFADANSLMLAAPLRRSILQIFVAHFPSMQISDSSSLQSVWDWQ